MTQLLLAVTILTGWFLAMAIEERTRAVSAQQLAERDRAETAVMYERARRREVLAERLTTAHDFDQFLDGDLDAARTRSARPACDALRARSAPTPRRSPSRGRATARSTTPSCRCAARPATSKPSSSSPGTRPSRRPNARDAIATARRGVGADARARRPRRAHGRAPPAQRAPVRVRCRARDGGDRPPDRPGHRRVRDAVLRRRRRDRRPAEPARGLPRRARRGRARHAHLTVDQRSGAARGLRARHRGDPRPDPRDRARPCHHRRALSAADRPPRRATELAAVAAVPFVAGDETIGAVRLHFRAGQLVADADRAAVPGLRRPGRPGARARPPRRRPARRPPPGQPPARRRRHPRHRGDRGRRDRGRSSSTASRRWAAPPARSCCATRRTPSSCR